MTPEDESSFTHLPRDCSSHRRRRRAPKNVLESRPPARTRSKVMREGDSDPAGSDLGSGELRFDETNRVGELLERVLLEVVVVAALETNISNALKLASQGTHLVVRYDNKVGVLDSDRPIPKRLDEKVIAQERQRRLVEVPARLRLEVIVNRLREFDDMRLRQLIEGRSERAPRSWEDDGVPGNGRYAIDEADLRDGLCARGVVRKAVGVGERLEGSFGASVAAPVSSALARVRGEADEGGGTVDRAHGQVLGSPSRRFASRWIAQCARVGVFERDLKSDESVVLLSVVAAALDGEGRVGEGGASVLGRVGDLGGDDGCSRRAVSEGVELRRSERTHDRP